jgi:putative ATP-dependent endonuclease of OLD family
VKPEPATRQIKDKLKSQTWRDRYESAKQVIRNAQVGAEIGQADLGTLDSLFTWEQDVARVNVCRDDADARSQLAPVLDSLRASGIIILSKGAIEDYYPDGAPTVGQKPARALEACKLVENEQDAMDLSSPLGPARPPELFEAFQAIFQQAG